MLHSRRMASRLTTAFCRVSDGVPRTWTGSTFSGSNSRTHHSLSIGTCCARDACTHGLALSDPGARKLKCCFEHLLDLGQCAQLHRERLERRCLDRYVRYTSVKSHSGCD